MSKKAKSAKKSKVEFDNSGRKIAKKIAKLEKLSDKVIKQADKAKTKFGNKLNKISAKVAKLQLQLKHGKVAAKAIMKDTKKTIKKAKKVFRKEPTVVMSGGVAR